MVITKEAIIAAMSYLSTDDRFLEAVVIAATRLEAEGKRSIVEIDKTDAGIIFRCKVCRAFRPSPETMILHLMDSHGYSAPMAEDEISKARRDFHDG